MIRSSTYHGGSFIILAEVVRPSPGKHRPPASGKPGETVAVGPDGTSRPPGHSRIGGLKRTIHGTPVDIGAWWRKYKSWNKVQWLKAYYAECFLDIIKSKTYVCPNCGGKGYFEILSTGVVGGGPRKGGSKKLCLRCFGFKRFKKVSYK